MFGTWMNRQLLACKYPVLPRHWKELQHHKVVALFNFTETGHDAEVLQKYGLREYHFPVKNFCAPTQAQLKEVVALLVQLHEEDKVVACHCLGGKGRTGTFLACYYIVAEKKNAFDAMQWVRRKRDGSIETAAQELAISQFYQNLQSENGREK